MPRHVAWMLSGLLRHTAYTLGDEDYRNQIIGIETAPVPGGDRSLMAAMNELDRRQRGASDAIWGRVAVILAADSRLAQPELPETPLADQPIEETMSTQAA